MANQTHFLINPFTFVFVMVVMLPSLASFEIERDDFLLGCGFGESFKRKFKKPFFGKELHRFKVIFSGFSPLSYRKLRATSLHLRVNLISSSVLVTNFWQEFLQCLSIL